MVTKQHGQHVIAKEMPCGEVAEELGDVDEHRVEKLVHLAGILFDVLEVSIMVADAQLLHAPAGPAPESAGLVSAQIQFELGSKPGEHVLERCGGRRHTTDPSLRFRYTLRVLDPLAKF